MVSCSRKSSGKGAWKGRVKSASAVCEGSGSAHEANHLDMFQLCKLSSLRLINCTGKNKRGKHLANGRRKVKITTSGPCNCLRSLYIKSKSLYLLWCQRRVAPSLLGCHGLCGWSSQFWQRQGTRCL